MDYYSLENDQDEDEENLEFKGNVASKEQVVFLVDVCQTMFATILDNEKRGKQSSFDLSMRVVADMLKGRILSSENDEIALVFYNTMEEKNASHFDHVYTFFDLDVPDALRIRQVEDLTAEKFNTTIGGMPDTEASCGETMKYAFWTASQMFEHSTQKATKKILLFTNQDDPCSGEGDIRAQITARVEQLRDAKVHLSLFPLVPAGSTFNMDGFWKPITNMLNDNDDYPDDEDEDVLTRLDALFDSVRKQCHKKRPVASMMWSIGKDMEVGIQIFSLVKPAVKAPPAYLDAKSNERVFSSVAYVCVDTGAVLSHIPLYSFQVASGNRDRYPKVVLTQEEKKKIKATRKPGLKLLGFKPLASLMDYHQLSTPYFVYPDEKKVKGSMTAFAAFHNRMLANGKFAVCEYVRNKISDPTLVALTAQEEVLDSYGCQVEPPGFHMIPLPFSDDLRHPEKAPVIVGSSIPQTSEQQIHLAGEMIKALSLSVDFTSADIPNPQLQRHYQVIEAVALQEPVPDLSSFEDETKPDLSGIEQHQVVIQAFKRSVDLNDNDQPLRKRKASNVGSAESFDSWNWNNLVASDRLSTLTAVQLKIYLQYNNLRLTGKKSELIDRIKEDLLAKK